VGKSGAQAPLFLFEGIAKSERFRQPNFFTQNFPAKARIVFRKVELFAGRRWAKIATCAANSAGRFCRPANSAGWFFPDGSKIDV
jgi:hypothetical protein